MRFPRRWLWLLLVVPIIAGLLRLRFDVEVLNLLPQDLKTVQGLKLYQEHFANARELIVTIHAGDAEQAENAARAVAEELRRETNLVAGALWQPPWLEHPGQFGELIGYLWLNQPPEILGELASRLAPEKLRSVLEATREELATSMSPAEIARSSYDPFGLTRLPESVAGAAPSFSQGQEMFSSADGTFRIIFAQANRDLKTYRDCARWLGAIRKKVEEILAAKDNPLAPALSPSQGERENRNQAIQPLKPSKAPTLPGNRNVSVGYTGRPAFVAEVATGMERDITTSVGGTSLIIAALFWLAHRRWKPMLWLLTLLALILGATLALGGLIFGTISVISMGFAAILLGLAVDYAVVHYQEALAHPDLSVPEIRHAIAPSIFWAAVTSISAFIVLNFGGLPGLGQLGSLVGLGIGLSACVMIFAFLPPLFPERRRRRENSQTPNPKSHEKEGKTEEKAERPGATRIGAVFSVTGALLLFSVVILTFGLPKMDPTANALRPRNSSSYAALEDVKKYLNNQREPLWLLVAGPTPGDVVLRLQEIVPALKMAVSNQAIANFILPTPLWPRLEFQTANRATARALCDRQESLHQAALATGFSEHSLGLTDQILSTWSAAGKAAEVFWPTNEMSQWIFQKVVARTATNYFALGFLNPTERETSSINNQASEKLQDRGTITALEAQLPREQVWLSGWELLGSSIFLSVKRNMWKLLVPMIGLVLLSLWLAFRRFWEVLLSLAVLALSGLCLLTIMRLAGWSWNLLNLMALPLVLGTGVDYSIFMQLALRRYHGDLVMAYRSVGRALLLCGATAIAGFGSLAWSGNAGMASLGAVCSVGIAGNMLISVFLLPAWWRAGKASSFNTEARDAKVEKRDGLPQGPSLFYCAMVWRMGLGIVRLLPEKLCARLGHWLAAIYWRMAPKRREVVIQNLLPAVGGNLEAAEKKARELFHQFALKLLDLWRFESGMPIDNLFGEDLSWQQFLEARNQKRGVLLVTPHLGNWEFGGPALSRKGIPLQVITLAEPGRAFTRLRQNSRARQNIETIVIGDDPFVFVDIIRRLEAGATVALLVDRPSPNTAATVELFGRPFAASIAAAELARASGCVVMPVYMLRNAAGYSAQVLPAIPYDRGKLRDRQARQQLTQEIMRAFEPVIREHLDQWYHFVPVWDDEIGIQNSAKYPTKK